MPRLQLESPEDIISLDEQLDTGYGVQVHSGVTGLGLPPVATQWLEGAGDGATYRGSRTLQRDIDLPLSVLARNRAELKATLTRLARALAGECTLRLLDDDGTSWWTKVVRVGGGDYTYGADTRGDRDWQGVITVRAGDPYWTSDTPTQTSIRKKDVRGLLPRLVNLRLSNGQAIGSILLDNPGDAPAYPTWRINGPGDHFKAVSPKGEVLAWDGTLAADESLVIDTKAGTLIDGTGANRYADLAIAPRMWRVPPGSSTCVASLDNSSVGTLSTGKVLFTNLAIDPSFEYGSTAWAAWGAARYTICSAPPRNLLTADDSSFEASLGSTVAVTPGLTISRTNEVPAADGTWCLKYVCAGTGTSEYARQSPVTKYAVKAGTTVSAMASYRSASTVQPVRTYVQFYDAAGNFISQSGGPTQAVSRTDSWVEHACDAVAPAGAVYATVAATIEAADIAAGEVHYVDKVGLFNAPLSAVQGWRVGGQPDAGPHSAVIAPQTGDGISGVAQRINGLTVGGKLSAACTARRIAGSSQFELSIGFYAADGSWVPPNNLSARLTPTAGGIDRLTVVATIPAGADHAFVNARFDAPVTGDVVGVDDFMVVNGATLPGYFDGDTADSEEVGIFDWTGTTGLSTSTQSEALVSGRSEIVCSYSPRQWLVI